MTLTKQEAEMIEAAMLIALAEANIPTDVQGLLVQGDAMRGIPPHALTKLFAAARPFLKREERERVLKRLREPSDQMVDVIDVMLPSNCEFAVMDFLRFIADFLAREEGE